MNNNGNRSTNGLVHISVVLEKVMKEVQEKYEKYKKEEEKKNA